MTDASRAGAAKLRGVALDLDGTLLRSDHTISAVTLQVCRQLIARGVWLTLASARPPESVRQFGESLGSPGPWIALNGAVVFTPDRRIIHRCALPRDIVTDILRRYRDRNDVSVNIYSGFDWLVLRHDPRSDAEA
ncbi:MAG TPA: HAD hydrolase family protein, partial [Xanthobacteraceae bacterium]|nr:HAD hydrolase family protein [Xanthobacteraceae bacterium]